jgi:hypothetical protein
MQAVISRKICKDSLSFPLLSAPTRVAGIPVILLQERVGDRWLWFVEVDRQAER